MGSNCSCVRGFTCFANDKNVTTIDVIRHESIKWIWSDTHEAALQASLTDIPMDIIHLIKKHAFYQNKDNFISKPSICGETYYYKLNNLISRNLCFKWYVHQMYWMQSLPIIVTGKNKASKQRIYDSFANHSQFLPVLHMYTSFDQSELPFARRTVVINKKPKCKVSVKLSNTDLNMINPKIIGNAAVFMIILNESDDINDADEVMEEIIEIDESFQKKTCILVRIDERNVNNKHNYKDSKICTNAEDTQLCRKYNMSSIQTTLNSDKSIHDLFSFCIKYHWFCHSQSENINIQTR